MPLEQLLKTISSAFAQFSFADLVDVVLIAFLIYGLIVLTRRTRAYQVLKGLGIFFLVTIICEFFNLTVINWLLGNVLLAGVTILVVLFQPELRRMLETIGRGTSPDRETSNAKSATLIVNEVHRAVLSLAKRRVGALMVIEQKTGLEEIVGTGIRVRGDISEQLIENVFEPNTPLHDGAMIIRGNKIEAVACFLPLYDDMAVAKELGTRHRAGLGVSAVSDSVTVIVSEETGVISIARDGRLIRYIDSKALKDLLESIYIVEKKKRTFNLLKRGTKNGQK